VLRAAVPPLMLSLQQLTIMQPSLVVEICSFTCIRLLASVYLHPGAVLLAISEWNPLPPLANSDHTPQTSSSSTTTTSIPPDMLNSCHEILAAHARGMAGDSILKVCGLSSALGHCCEEEEEAGTGKAASRDATCASLTVGRTPTVTFSHWRKEPLTVED
jgi:hypothetical protein